MGSKRGDKIADFVAAQLALGKKPNRLIHEKSPYLLQHAFNPVDWYAWGQEAFARAQREDKPIFLSIGYSTCHWCHVMEHESFENPEIAAILNRYFICIKVDREERPDIDQIYMAVTQAMTGSGGWPMSLFLTPDRQPFYAGTYFPSTAQYGRPGFPDILKSIHQAWLDNRQEVVGQAGEITARLQKMVAADNEAKVDNGVAALAAEQLIRGYDHKYGGFGNAPKFPRPVVMNFLLRYARRKQRPDITAMIINTLENMASGGMYDQLGGGFHRYSVDARWRVPHFEKMLYDQAQLAVSYLEAYQVSGDDFLAATARQTLDYVLREMTDKQGMFYSAEDADSPEPDNPAHSSEGAFYLWRQSDIRKILGRDADIFIYRYGISGQGNTLSDPQGEFKDGNVLYLAHSKAETARKFSLSAGEVATALANGQRRLRQARAKRPRPHLDDKSLVSWNGLMISALAKGYRVLGRPEYLAAAQRAAQFIYDKMYDRSAHTLLHRYRDGEAGIAGQLADYSFLTQGLLDLYEADFNVAWLTFARALSEKQLSLFADARSGGFFDSAGDDSAVLVRMKADYDGAEPAANSVAALNFLRMARIFNSGKFKKIAADDIHAFAGQLNKYPAAMPQMLVAREFQRYKPVQVVIIGRAGQADTLKMAAAVNQYFLPELTVILVPPDEQSAKASPAEAKPYHEDGMRMQDGRATAYLCENFTCRRPTTEAAELLGMLGDLARNP